MWLTHSLLLLIFYSFTSYLLPLTFYLLPLASYLLPLTSCLLSLISCLLSLISCLLSLGWLEVGEEAGLDDDANAEL
jgi:hypothetical protein